MATFAQILDFLLAGLEDQNGNPLSGGKIEFYAAGTTTPKDTYTDRAKTSPSTNPIVLDVYGRAVVYGDGLYKFVIKDSNDNTIKTIDNYNSLDVADHSSRHENGGADEISVTGLSGDLAHINLSTSYINKDYVSGDEDAILDFNNGMASIKLEYLSSESVRQFTVSDRLRINETSVAEADYGTLAGWSLHIGHTAVFHSATNKPALCGWFEMANEINDLVPEVGAVSGFIYAVKATSKAVNVAGDFYVLKQGPCITENKIFTVSAILCGDVDPGSSFENGVGFRAYSGDMGGTGVRQTAAYLAQGNRGWNYSFLSVDLNNYDILASIDYVGGMYLAKGLEIGGDYGAGFAGRLRLTNVSFGISGGGHGTVEMNGATPRDSTGWLKIYDGITARYIPFWITITG